MRIYLVLDRDEVNAQVPYDIVCETMGGSRWNTGRRKRAWKEQFTEQEQRKCRELLKLANDWYLRYGVPEFVRMAPDTLQLWQRLGNFCCSL